MVKISFKSVKIARMSDLIVKLLPSNEIVYDIIIIGAGLSGLQCGSALINKYGVNKNKILVFEAQSYVGGRVKQETNFIKGFKLELGAECLHGRHTELNKFALEHNEPLYEVYPSSFGDGGPAEKPVAGGYGLYYIGAADGDRPQSKSLNIKSTFRSGIEILDTIDNKTYKDRPQDIKRNSRDRLLRFDDKDPDFCALSERLWELAELNEDDYPASMSLYDYLLSKKLNTNMLKMANGGFANTLCANLKELSLKQIIRWSRLWNAEGIEGEDDKDYTFKNSYSCLVDHLKKDLQIELNAPVAHIAYPNTAENDLVTIVAKNGTVYQARNIVVTASPHVINTGLLKFSPELPADIKGAFECSAMNSVTKVILKFSKRCWPENLHGMTCVDDSFLQPEMWFNEFSPEEVYPDEPATAYAVGFTTAKYAERLKTMSQEEVLQQSVAQLEKIFGMLEQRHMSAEGVNDPTAEPPSSLPSPSSVYLGGMIYSWGKDSHPYIGGGYGSPLVGKPINAGEILSRPHGEHMFFAGEATNFLPGATAHSALETGLRAAEQVSKQMKKDGRL